MITNIECLSMDNYGYGEFKQGHKIYKIPNFLPGETAKVELFNNGTGKVREYISLSNERIKPKCPRYFECGGCQLQHFTYEKQLELKTKSVEDAFGKYGVSIKTFLPIIAAKSPFHYRNKNQMVISLKGKKVMSGFYEEFTHNIVNVDECVIQDDRANQIIKTMRYLFQLQHIEPYDEDKKTGLIRHVLVRTSDSTKEILVVLVTKEEMFPGRNNFVKALREAHPEISTIVQNINPRATSVILGDFERVLFGSGNIKDIILGKTFLISSKTFYQINSRQTETLYRMALELAKPKKEDTMLDLYCGVGTIGIIFSDHVKKVIGVEINKDSVKNAILNSRVNHADNARFFHSDALDYMQKMIDDKSKVDILLVDPPREGLDSEFIKLVQIMKPRKFVYISCNPETLARDVQNLIREHYSLVQVRPIDMFPQTNHVESVSLLELK